jgi:hypothetical protein
MRQLPFFLIADIIIVTPRVGQGTQLFIIALAAAFIRTRA